MPNRQIESCDSSPALPEARTFENSEAKLLLMRRRKSCPGCGSVHGPPQARCEPQEARIRPPDSDAVHLPWTF